MTAMPTIGSADPSRPRSTATTATANKRVTDDVAEQGRILARVADLVDEGRLRTTVAHQLQGLTVDNIVEGTALVESGRMVGKIVVTA